MVTDPLPMSACGGRDWRKATTRGQCTRRMARVWFQCVEMVSLYGWLMCMYYVFRVRVCMFVCVYKGGWNGGRHIAR